jgi:hypothetical protein
MEHAQTPPRTSARTASLPDQRRWTSYRLARQHKSVTTSPNVVLATDPVRKITMHQAALR